MNDLPGGHSDDGGQCRSRQVCLPNLLLRLVGQLSESYQGGTSWRLSWKSRDEKSKRTSGFGNALSIEPATTGDEGSGGSSSKRGRWRGGQVVVKTFVLHSICILLYGILYVWHIVLHIYSFISAAGSPEMDLHLIRLFRRMCVEFHWILKKYYYQITKSIGQQ